MKKKITTALLTIATVYGFAQTALPEVRPTAAQLEVKPTLSLKEKITPKKSFGYLKMGVSDAELRTTDLDEILPGFGVGYRLASGSSAIDLSASFNHRRIATDTGRKETYRYVLPKANYLYYVTAENESSLYAGAGLAWGGIKNKGKEYFTGLIPNVALGYEFNRMGTLRSFMQLDVSQPAIAAVREGGFPKAFAELTIGAGF